MSEKDSIDIDDIEDFQRAESLLKEKFYINQKVY